MFKNELAKQKELMEKLNNTKLSDHEKASTMEMLKLTMFHIKDLQKALSEKQIRIKQSQNTIKANCSSSDLHRPRISSVASSSDASSTCSTASSIIADDDDAVS